MSMQTGDLGPPLCAAIYSISHGGVNISKTIPSALSRSPGKALKALRDDETMARPADRRLEQLKEIIELNALPAMTANRVC